MQERSATARKYNAPVEMRTCHDIRQFLGCSHCGGMGDKRHMVPTGAKYMHGRCYIEREGMAAFLKLPKKITDKLYLEDIGNRAMRALIGR